MSGMTFKYQGEMAKASRCPERILKTPLPQQSSSSSRDEESQWVGVEDRRRRSVAFEETAKGILKYLKDGEDLKVSVTELQEQQGISEETCISIELVAQQTRNERQGEEDVCIASWARWNAQLKGLAELERRCQNMRQEVKLLSERQEILKGMVEDKITFVVQSNGKVLRANF